MWSTVAQCAQVLHCDGVTTSTVVSQLASFSLAPSTVGESSIANGSTCFCFYHSVCMYVSSSIVVLREEALPGGCQKGESSLVGAEG